MKKWAIAAMFVTAAVGVYSLIAVHGANASNLSKETANVQSEARVIRDKMLNAVDHYSYAKGSFLSTNTQGDTRRIIFEVVQGENPGSRVLVEDEHGNKLRERISDANILVTKDFSNKTFTKSSIVKWGKPEDSRTSKNEDGNNVYIYRRAPASASYAAEVTFPQEVAFWINDEEKNVTSIGHTTMFGREATIIKGSMLKSMRGKAEKFAMYVDTETGILLGLETTRDDGTPGMSVKVEEIVIDQEPGMTASSFDTSDPVGYTEIQPDNIKQMVEEKSRQAAEETNKH